jgi:hypothetical protein
MPAGNPFLIPFLLLGCCNFNSSSPSLPGECDSLQEQGSGLQPGAIAALKDAKLQGMMNHALAAPARYAFLMQ